MRKLTVWAAVVSLVCLLAACATAEVTGQRMSTATSAVGFSSVDVVFLDKPSMKRTDLGGLFANPNSYSALTDRVTRDVRQAMSEARDGVQVALAAHGIQGRAYLASDVNMVPKQTSHKVFVSLVSVEANPQNTVSITLKVVVMEAATNQLLWQGQSKTYPGGEGFSRSASEAAILKKQKNFGDGIVRALREAGLAVDASPAKSG